QTGHAWPSYPTIVAMTGLAHQTVKNAVCELRAWGYLIAEKRKVESAGNELLTVSTFGKIDHATIEREITKFVQTKVAERTPPSTPSYPVGYDDGEAYPTEDASVPQEVRDRTPQGTSNLCKELESREHKTPEAPPRSPPGPGRAAAESAFNAWNE